MRNFTYIVYFTIFLLLKNCSPECTHYYIMLNEYFDTDLTQERIEPTSMKTITLDHPLFNSTEEFKELQDNVDCILEFKSTPACPLNSTTLCLRPVPDRVEINTYETTTVQAYNSTNGDAVAANDHETYTTYYNSSDYETTTVGAETYNSTNDNAALIADNTENYNSTNSNAALTNGKAANDTKETVKTVGIVAAGATGTAALGYFITMKIKHMLQYGAYHLP